MFSSNISVSHLSHFLAFLLLLWQIWDFLLHPHHHFGHPHQGLEVKAGKSGRVLSCLKIVHIYGRSLGANRIHVNSSMCDILWDYQ